MSFDDLIEEKMGFGTGSYMDLDELRLLYYGRRDLYIAFTDDGEYDFEQSPREIDRPNSIVCYPVNDVVGRKVRTSEFYANVFRLNKNRGEFIKNINHYSKDDLMIDLAVIKDLSPADAAETDMIIQEVMYDTRIRKPFEKFWTITEYISKTRGSLFGRVWRKLLLDMGYIGFADPSNTGIFTGYRTPAVVYIDYQAKNDIDILPIQKHREDPRKRVRDKVSRMVRRMGVRRNRIAKRRTGASRSNKSKSTSASDAIKQIGGML